MQIERPVETGATPTHDARENILANKSSCLPFPGKNIDWQEN
jgi:hypothetical protein